MTTPFPRSYWVVPGRLLAGCYPGSVHPVQAEANLTGLLACGILHIVNLMEEDEVNRDGDPFVSYDEVFRTLAAGMGLQGSCSRFPIEDLGVPSRETMGAILNGIDHSLSEGRPVYLHCWGGRGRTGTVVGCYLARHGISTGQAALTMIDTLRRFVPDTRRASPETDAQRAMVTSWKEGE